MSAPIMVLGFGWVGSGVAVTFRLFVPVAVKTIRVVSKLKRIKDQTLS